MATLPPEIVVRLRELETLYETLRTITSTLDLGSLLLNDEARGELVFAASEILSAETLVVSGAVAFPTEPPSTGTRLTASLRSAAGEIGRVEVHERHDGGPFG